MIAHAIRHFICPLSFAYTVSEICTLLHVERARKKAIASNDNGQKRERKNYDEENQKKKKKTMRKTIENAMKHHRMNIVPTFLCK